MSPSRKSSEEECGFKWGKKKGIGGKKKEVQFYGSFTFDGVEYSLYDNVYVYKEDEPEPYIGKLVKIWEQPLEKKKVKLLWFFRPIELLNFLEDGAYLENELFLATGTGLGLANVNPLEAIAGKCRVVCTSNDSRNRQPSPEELRMADYVFYRTFNVGTYTISEKIDDKIVDVEARFLLNRECGQQSSDVRVEKEVIGNVEGSKGELRRCPELNTEGSFLNEAVDDKAGPSVLKKDESSKISVNQDSLSVKDLGADSGAKTMEIEVPGVLQDSVPLSRKKLSHPLTVSRMDEVDAGVPSSKVEDKNFKINEDLGLDDKPAKKARIDSSVKLPVKHKAGPSMLKNDDSSKISVNQDSLSVKGLGVDSGANTMEIEVLGALQESVPLSKKKLSHPLKDSRMDEVDAGIPICKVEDKNLKISEDLALDDKPAKKSRIDDSVKLPVKHNDFLSSASIVDKKQSILQKEEKTVENDVLQVPGTVVCDGDGKKSKRLKDLPRPDKDSFKKVKPDEKASKKSNSTVPNTKAVNAAKENVIFEGQVMDVTRKPDTDRSRWFKDIEWDNRIIGAHEKGTLVLLENLDPTYSSSEIEDIIWSGFRESCTAKVVPQTALSSPHSGQASVVFKSRDAADTAIRKLSEGCLLLPNGRPLVASYGTPILDGDASTYLGHLDVDTKKYQRSEQREAVSTSHYSQPNTIEYDMAMEWCRLQKLSEKMWENLYKQQGVSLEKLKGKLKSKLI